MQEEVLGQKCLTPDALEHAYNTNQNKNGVRVVMLMDRNFV